MKYLKWTITTILTLVFLAAAGSWLWLQSKKPDTNTELHLPGLQKPVEILYDEHGIPHIYAANEQDAYCALGYAHARDRLFQMEMLRRLADGRLSEVIGDKTIEVDKFFRTLSIRRHARHTVEEVYSNPNDSAVLAANAYFRGVNYFLEHGPTPPEFDMLGIPKQPFTLEDGLVVGGYMGFSFTDAFDTEAINELVLQKLGPQYLADLSNEWDSAAVKIPVQAPKQLSHSARDADLLLSLSATVRDIQAYCQTLPPFLGSNGWVLAPSRTKNGKVILENDTHIGFSQPSVWYEAHLNYGGYSLYGNFIAGAPLAVLGHTNDVAWGLTMFENDDVDFYRETLNPDNPNQVKFRDAWEDMEVQEEIIKVKEGEEVRLPVRKTRHGYLVNGIARPFKSDTLPLALWWIYQQAPDRGPLAFYRLAHARDVRDAEQAVALMHAPGLNVMFGDAAGNIAWWAAGALPKRPAHVRPWLVLDGASGRDEIEGWLPFSENPHNVNPPEGLVYSANNQPDRVGERPFTPGYYVPEDRARRISMMLASRKTDWTAEAVRQMTLDTRNPVFPGIAQQVLAVLPQASLSEPERKAAGILKDWSGSHELTDVAPTIFYRWLYHFYRNTFGDELGEDGLKMLQAAHLSKRLLEPLSRNEQSVWWDDVSTAGRRETRAEVFEKSFHQAVADLVAQLGADTAAWQWQKVHTLEHKHPLGVLPAVGSWFNVGPLPCPGGRETINNLDFPLDSTGLYRVTYGPALRRVFDFSAPGQGMSINPTGQSGLLNSPFYADQARMYVAGEFRHEWTRRVDVERVKSSRLVLRP